MPPAKIRPLLARLAQAQLQPPHAEPGQRRDTQAVEDSEPGGGAHRVEAGQVAIEITLGRWVNSPIVQVR